MLFDTPITVENNLWAISDHYSFPTFRAVSFLLLASLFLVGSANAQKDSGLIAQRPCNHNPLIVAFERHDVKEFDTLLAAGADANAANCAEETILMLTSIQGTPELVRSLLRAGANPNTSQRGGRTALLWAIGFRRLDTVKVLIEGGADVNKRTPSGFTPLMMATTTGNLEMLELLLKAGAEPSQSNDDSVSALALAGWSCHQDIARRLISAGAKTTDRDWKKMRPPRFEEFPVEKQYRGTPAKIDLNSTPWAREYRTRLREGRKKGPNFAGRFTVVDWGCGSNCQVYSLIDVRDGKVYSAGSADRGAEYKLNSALFILDPTFTGQAYEGDPTSRVPARYFVWKEGRFAQVYEEACRVEGGEERCGCPEVQKLIFGKKKSVVPNSDEQRD